MAIVTHEDLGCCDQCGRSDVFVHKVKTADDSGLTTLKVCQPCDELSQGLMSREQWQQLVGPDARPPQHHSRTTD